VTLGITWVLDGLEVTIVGTLGARLTERAGLGLSPVQVGSVAPFYIIAAVVGAVELAFGVSAERKSLEDIATPLTAVAVQRAA
jgi:hypothetical protein